MRVTAAQMLLRAGGNIVHLAALAKAIERQLVWVRAARSEQAEVDQLVVADEDKYTRLVERLCNWWNDGQLIVQATGRPTPMSLDLWRKNRTLLLLAKKLIEEGGVADAWLALNREVHEMQKVLKAICDQIQRPCTLPPPKERFFLEYYFVWMH